MSLREPFPDSVSPGTVWSCGQAWCDRTLQSLGRYERELWLLTLGAMLVDVTLTVHGLQLGLRELNPVARAALDTAGVLGLYALKGVALTMGVCCVRLIPSTYSPLVPLGLAIPSVLAVIINTTVISIVLL